MAKPRVRTGGRGARIEAAVHAAVKDLCAGMDRSDLSVPIIAERAGVTPSTVYRRWGCLAELLSDVALERLRPLSGPLDTGRVEGDLAAWVEQYAEEMSSDVGRTMLRDLISGSPEAGNLRHCFAYNRDQIAVIARRAAARGEAPPDVEAVIDHVVAPIIYRILIDDGLPDMDYCRALLVRLRRN